MGEPCFRHPARERMAADYPKEPPPASYASCRRLRPPLQPASFPAIMSSMPRGRTGMADEVGAKAAGRFCLGLEA